MDIRIYLIFLPLMIVCAIFAAYASRKVHSAFAAFDEVPTRSRMTGYDTATRLLRRNGVTDISVGRVRGRLSDHYHPTKKIVNLSESTYGSDSVAAVAVAAHEIGHVMQKKQGYIPYKLRSVLVPLVNFGARLAMPLVLIGILLDAVVYATAQSNAGYYLALAGVVLYGLSTLFTLVTLPVEFNASRRAKQMLVQEGILAQEEIGGADKVLDAAALTYVAALVTSLVYFLRFALIIISIFGRNRRR